MPRRSNIIYEQQLLSSEHSQSEHFVDAPSIINHSSVYKTVNTDKDRNIMRQDRDVDSREAYMESFVMEKIRAEPIDMSDGLMQVPINGKKTSRRKQSKPIRVSFIDVDTLDSELTTVPQNNTQPEQMEGIEENGDNINDSGVTVEGVGKALERQEVNGCDMCGETFASESELKHHITIEHLSKNSAEDRFSFPTKYHRLGNEFQQATALKQEVTETEEVVRQPQTSTPTYLPPSYESSTTVSSHDSSAESKSARIFHPDAYCEICDREFCNKYFLKTHKANKHGIYDNSSSYSAAFPAVSSSLDQNSRISSSPEQVNPALPPTMPSISSHEQTHTPPKQLDTQAAMQSILDSTTKLNQITSSSSSAPTDAEDYCEICQKHFCNKYYLKKHKQDVHGIGLSDQYKRQRLMQPENHILNSLTSSITSSATPTASLIIPQPHFTTATNNSSANNLANIATVNSMGNIMLLNPFVPPMAILQAQSLIPAHSQPMNPTSVHSLTSLATAGHAQSLPSDNSTALSLVQQDINKPDSLAQSPSNLVIDKSKTVTQSTSDSPNAPKNMTLASESANADHSTEVRCDMCSKEFYNVFFLRIHKANKHGVHMDDIPKKSKGSSQGGDMEMSSPQANSELHKKLKFETETASAMALEDAAGMEPGEKERDRPATDAEDFCTMCNKEFASKYSLKIHMINVHGVKPTDFSAFSAVVPNENQIANHDTADLESEKEKAVLATMFGSIVAAKMADRVTCDICQKEVCNKYFLKTHKMKVHGIAPTPDKDGNSNGSSENSVLKSEVIAKPESAEKPPEAELLKMGIDPEAYCEICKKEFCSKYFLKTHKLNIHGIKDKKDCSSASLLMSKINKKELSQIFSSNLNMVSSAQLASVDNSMSVNQMTTAIPTSIPMVTSSSPISKIDKLTPILPYVPSPQMVPSGLRIESLNSAEKRHWKWKEPVNATRVSCDICNKELCNKYFLRTHRLNKHGITDEGGSPLKIPSLHGSSSSASSTTSEKADYHGMEDKADHFSSTLGMKLNLVREARGDNDEGRAEKVHSSCLLCSKQFQDERELGLHILTEHKLKTEDGQDNSDNRMDESQAGLKCGLCGSVFMDTMSLQLHLIHDHQGRVAISESPQKIGTSAFSTISTIGMSLKKRYAKNGKPKLHSCSQCDYKSRWLSNIYSHEDRKHRGVDGPQKQHTCTECSRVFRYNHSLVRHLQEHHGRFIGNSDSTSGAVHTKDLDSNIIANQYRMRQKNYKCARCGCRFTSRLQCQTHIRMAHRVRKEDAPQTEVISPSSGCNLQCTICPFACKSTLALRAHMAIKHQRKLRQIPQNASLVTNGDDAEKETSDQINEDVEMSPEVVSEATPSSEDMQNFIMQPFTMKDMSPEKSILTSLVRLPVLQKITEPINITISLKPTDN